MAEAGEGGVEAGQKVIWRPNPGPQTLALTCPYEDILYGGALGGGKSDLLLARFVQQAAQYRAAAHGILFRRSFPEFQQLIKRSRILYGGAGARYNSGAKVWTFPGSATMRFAYLSKPGDHEKYMGPEYTYMAFDQLEGWETPEEPDALLSRLRSTEGVPTLHISSANPLGPGHQWIFERYVKDWRPYEMHVIADEGGAKIRRVFIPARLEDNPYLLADRLYQARIRQATLGKPWLWEAWRHGDWYAKPPTAWFDFEKASILPVRPVGVRKWLRFWDFAATNAAREARKKRGRDPDYTAGALVGIRASGAWVWAHTEMFRKGPSDVEERVKSIAHLDGRAVSVKIEQEPGSAGIHLVNHYVRTVLPGWDVAGFRTTGDKALYINPLHGQWQTGNVSLVAGEWIGQVRPQVVAYPSPGVHDDALDAAAKGFHCLTANKDPLVYVE